MGNEATLGVCMACVNTCSCLLHSMMVLGKCFILQYALCLSVYSVV